MGYFPKSNVRYTLCISKDNPSGYELCFGIRELLSNPYASHMSPQTSALNTPSKFVRAYNDKEPYKNGSRMPLSAGTTSLGRPSSGRREFIRSFNTTTAAGVSPGAVTGLSEVRRVHVGMSKGDRIHPDCDGFVLTNECSEIRDTQVTNERSELRDISVVSDDCEDTSGSTDISPVAVYTRSGE